MTGVEWACLGAYWVLVLCLGLRRGEVLGLTWKSIDLETGELYVDHQIRRAGRQILHRETRTEESDGFLPLPELCLKALRMRHAWQDGDRKASGEFWQDTRGLVFTAKPGTRAARSWSPSRSIRRRLSLTADISRCRTSLLYAPPNAKGPGVIRGL